LSAYDSIANVSEIDLGDGGAHDESVDELF